LTGAERRRRRARATRTGLVVAIAVGAGATGLWWSHARHDGHEVGLRIDASIGVAGGVGPDVDLLEVHEDLHFDAGALGEEDLVRRIDHASFVEDDAEDPDAVLVLPRGDDGLTFVVSGETEGVVHVRYRVDVPEGGLDDLDLGTVNAAAELGLGTPDGSIGDARDVEAGEPLTVSQPEDGDQLPWTGIGLVVGLLAIGAWLLSLRRSRRARPTVDATDGLPSTHSPAEVGWLLRHGRVLPADLAATIVDLTARGFVVPYRRDGVVVLGQGRPPADLAPHEDLVLEWLFGDWVRQADLGERRAAIRERPERWSDLWTGFVEAVDDRGQAGGLVERDVASSTVLAAAAAGLVLLVAGVTGTAHGYPGWLAPVLAGALVLASATAFARRTAEGEALAAAWEAFGAQLRRGEGITPHALAYAVTLGEDAVAPSGGDPWPAQLVHEEVEGHVLAWREAYLSATSVRGEPSERVRALLSLRSLRRRAELLTG
jgi:hypothetical protein